MEIKLINSLERLKQPLYFGSIIYNEYHPYANVIYPTDIDGIIEYKRKAWVVIEVKHVSHLSVLTGQRIVLEEITTDFEKAGKKVLTIVVYHDIADPTELVDVGDCLVQRAYSKGEWLPAKEEITARELIFSFLSEVDKLL